MHELAARVEPLLPARARGWSRVSGGYSHAARWIVTLGDGRRVFVKAATDELTAGWLRAEWLIYSSLRAAFLPRVVAWSDGGDRPVLVLEDLSDAAWPPPWTPEQIDRVRRSLEEIGATEPPDGLPELTDLCAGLAGWRDVADDPAPFLSLAMCSPSWLEAALPELLAAASAAPLTGSQLLHGDVRSDNVCFAGERTLLVDWNWACAGNARFDFVGWLPSLHAEGGPAPWELVEDEPELVSWIAGYWAAYAGLPAPPGRQGVRTVQRRQLAGALPWAARSLGLPPPS